MEYIIRKAGTVGVVQTECWKCVLLCMSVWEGVGVGVGEREREIMR